VLEEDGQNVEPLLYLAVSVDQIGVVHREHVVDADVHVDARLAILVLEQGYFDRGHIAKRALLRHRLNDLATMFDQLVLVIRHPAMEDNDDIDIAATHSPESVHARASGADRDLAFEQIGLRAAIPIVEGVLDASDDLVARLQVYLLDALLLIDNSHDLLSALQGCGPCLRLPAVEPEDHMCAPNLLIFFDLLT